MAFLVDYDKIYYGLKGEERSRKRETILILNQTSAQAAKKEAARLLSGSRYKIIRARRYCDQG